MKTPARGSCQCGQVQFSLQAQPLFTYACHCHDCQQRTGSAFSMGMVVLEESLALEGQLQPWSRTSDDGNSNTRHSCAGCGNIIYGSSSNSPGLLKLQAGLLEDTRALQPEVHIWTCRSQGWVQLQDGVPHWETQPDDLTELLQAAIEFRGRP